MRTEARLANSRLLRFMYTALPLELSSPRNKEHVTYLYLYFEKKKKSQNCVGIVQHRHYILIFNYTKIITRERSTIVIKLLFLKDETKYYNTLLHMIHYDDYYLACLMYYSNMTLFPCVLTCLVYSYGTKTTLKELSIIIHLF